MSKYGTICRTLKRLNIWMNPWQLRVCMCVCVHMLSLVRLLHSCRLLTCKTGSVAWLRRSPASFLFQRRRPIAVCVIYSPALPLFQPRRPIAVCWRSLNAQTLCFVLSGVGRQPAPFLWLGLQQARCGVVAVVYIPQEMRPLLARGWR